MNKKILLSLALVGQIFALTPKQAYQKALDFEAKGEVSKAMEWYKKAASLSMGSQDLISNQPPYIQRKIKAVKKRKKAYASYFNKPKNTQTNNTIEQMLTGVFGIEPYHTNYLMPIVYDSSNHSDRKHMETEFQISLKKDLFENLLGFNEKYAFGYTQKSHWQTLKNSTPFRETNYQPEFFVYGFYGKPSSYLKGYQLGFLHESNGRDKEKSRSWNRIYLSTFWQFNNLFVTPRVWFRIPERDKKHINDDFGDDNPDILHYLGYGDLTLVYPYKKHLFRAKLRNNFKFNSHNKGSVEFDWTFPLLSDDVYGYVKAFSGYGASLEDYNSYSNRIGLGFALSR